MSIARSQMNRQLYMGGGITGLPYTYAYPGYARGGIVDYADRQNFGFGSFVKSVAKGVTGAVKGAVGAVKDIAKSPIGQIALSIAAPYALGALMPGFATLGGSGFLGSALRGGISNLAIQALSGQGIDPKRLLTSAVLSGGIGSLTKGLSDVPTGEKAFFNDALTAEEAAKQAIETGTSPVTFSPVTDSPVVIDQSNIQQSPFYGQELSSQPEIMAGSAADPFGEAAYADTVYPQGDMVSKPSAFVSDYQGMELADQLAGGATKIETPQPFVSDYQGMELADQLAGGATTIPAEITYGKGGVENFIQTVQNNGIIDALKMAGQDVLGVPEFKNLGVAIEGGNPLDIVKSSYRLLAENPTLVIGSSTLMSYLTAPQYPGESNEEFAKRQATVQDLQNRYASKLGSNIPTNLSSVTDYASRYASNLGYANGGRIGYAAGDSVQEGIMAAPQIASQMGMPVGNPRQNQGGVLELDYRDQGGFVPPIGIKERADDVPAMLSNNEFVFTADAVKNAGGGDPNVGAQRMYAMMKQLENGGRV